MARETMFVWEPAGREFKGVNLAQPGTLFSQHMQSGKTASFFMNTVKANGERSIVALHTVQPERLRMNSPLVIAIGYNLTLFTVIGAGMPHTILLSTS